MIKDRSIRQALASRFLSAISSDELTTLLSNAIRSADKMAHGRDGHVLDNKGDWLWQVYEKVVDEECPADVNKIGAGLERPSSATRKVL